MDTYLVSGRCSIDGTYYFHFCGRTSSRDWCNQTCIYKRPWKLYEFARTTVTKHHKSCGLNNRNLSHNPGGSKSGIKVSAGLVPSEGYGGDCLPCLSPSFRWFTGNLWCSLTCRYIPPPSATFLTWHSPCVYV